MASHCSNVLIISKMPPILPNNPIPLRPLPFFKHHHPKFSTPSAVVSTDSAVLKKADTLANRWQEIMGKDDWKGSLDSDLDPLLRRELLKYGDLCACTYEAFIDDLYDKHYGACKYHKSDFFDHMLMPGHGYRVETMIYCSSKHEWWLPIFPKPLNPEWAEENVWFGYIAVHDSPGTDGVGRREICVAWRGTVTGIEWDNDAWAILSPLPKDSVFMPNPNPKIKVENGFMSLYTEDEGGQKKPARRIILEKVQELVKTYQDQGEEVSITVTGHSLGASLAVLTAYDIAETGVNQSAPVTAITYAGPRLGNPKFKDRVDELGVKVLRLVNVWDVAPKVPGMFASLLPMWLLRILDDWGYPFAFTHVGGELDLDSADCPHFKQPPTITTAHNLEGYLNMIDGYRGKGKQYKSETGRDIALVNLYNDMLTEKSIPGNWRVYLNKSMALNKDGYWRHKTCLEENSN